MRAPESPRTSRPTARVGPVWEATRSRSVRVRMSVSRRRAIIRRQRRRLMSLRSRFAAPLLACRPDSRMPTSAIQRSRVRVVYPGHLHDFCWRNRHLGHCRSIPLRLSASDWRRRCKCSRRFPDEHRRLGQSRGHDPRIAQRRLHARVDVHLARSGVRVSETPDDQCRLGKHRWRRRRGSGMGPREEDRLALHGLQVQRWHDLDSRGLRQHHDGQCRVCGHRSEQPQCGGRDACHRHQPLGHHGNEQSTTECDADGPGERFDVYGSRKHDADRVRQ